MASDLLAYGDLQWIRNKLNTLQFLVATPTNGVPKQTWLCSRTIGSTMCTYIYIYVCVCVCVSVSSPAGSLQSSSQLDTT